MKKQLITHKKGIMISVIIGTLLLLFGLTQYHSNQAGVTTLQKEKPVFQLSTDVNATVGEIVKSPTVVDRLNEEAEQSMMNISMNSNPVFSDGVGNVLITNADTNYNPQVVEIYDGEERIYQSGVIPVGCHVVSGELSTDLPSGDYDCKAYFNSINGVSGELMGRVGINIKVTVE